MKKMTAEHAQGNTSATVDIYVKMNSGRTSTFLLTKADRIQKIYERIASEEGVAVDRVQIKYTGKCLDPAKTVGYVGICAETILKTEVLEVCQFDVSVKINCERTIALEVRNIHTISDIKEKISREGSVDVTRSYLKIGDRILDNDNWKAFDVGIGNGTVLELERWELEVKENTNDRSLSQMDDVEKSAVIRSFDAAGKSVEVVFSFDTTGSMMSCLATVRRKLADIAERLVSKLPSIRIGIIAHGDYCDYNNYVLRSVDLTSSVSTLVQFVDSVPKTGGGDAPECYEWVLRTAQRLDWSEHSAKALVVIGDCQPHPPSYTDQRINWHDELDVLKGMEVKVYGVRALEHENAEPFYRELAERTGGAYITFQNFDIVADMFLAVCYREASSEHFEEFCHQVDTQTGLSEAARSDVKDVLRQLDEQKTQPSQPTSQRYVECAWWDPTLDQGKTMYCYNSTTDTWCSFHETNIICTETVKPVYRTETTKKRSSFKFRRPSARASLPSGHNKRCCVM